MTRIRCFTTVVAQVFLTAVASAKAVRPAVIMLAALALAVPVGAFGQFARPRGAARADGQAVPRAGVVQAPVEGQMPQAEAPRAAEPTRSAVTRGVPPSRRVDFGAATAVPRVVTPRAVVPQVIQPRVIQPQVVQPQVEIGRPGDHPAYWPDYRPNYRPDYRQQYQPYYRPPYRPQYRPSYRPSYRPYYTFRPRVRLGFGLWVGFPVASPTYLYPHPSYPYASYPYASTYPYPNTYPNSTSIYAVPGAATAVGVAGGLSFEITPPEAGVYVDGQYVGTVGQFSPDQPPLALAPGRHHVEIREPGFEIIAFDIDILPGQVIPYQGDLRRF